MRQIGFPKLLHTAGLDVTVLMWMCYEYLSNTVQLLVLQVAPETNLCYLENGRQPLDRNNVFLPAVPYKLKAAFTV